MPKSEFLIRATLSKKRHAAEAPLAHVTHHRNHTRRSLEAAFNISNDIKTISAHPLEISRDIISVIAGVQSVEARAALLAETEASIKPIQNLITNADAFIAALHTYGATQDALIAQGTIEDGKISELSQTANSIKEAVEAADACLKKLDEGRNTSNKIVDDINVKMATLKSDQDRASSLSVSALNALTIVRQHVQETNVRLFAEQTAKIELERQYAEEHRKAELEKQRAKESQKLEIQKTAATEADKESCAKPDSGKSGAVDKSVSAASAAGPDFSSLKLDQPSQAEIIALLQKQLAEKDAQISEMSAVFARLAAPRSGPAITPVATAAMRSSAAVAASGSALVPAIEAPSTLSSDTDSVSASTVAPA